MLCSGDAPGAEAVTTAGREQPQVEENQGTEALPGEQSSEGSTRKVPVPTGQSCQRHFQEQR